jgi:hypothetical protein
MCCMSIGNLVSMIHLMCQIVNGSFDVSKVHWMYQLFNCSFNVVREGSRTT